MTAKPSSLLEAVARTRDQRKDAEAAFRHALKQAHRAHSWNEIAAVAQMHPNSVRYLTLNLDQRRKWHTSRKEPANGTAEANPDGS